MSKTSTGVPFLLLFLPFLFASSVNSTPLQADRAASATAATPLSIADNSDDQPSCEESLESFTSRQYRAADIHKAFAFTTAGLILAADGIGLYHFIQLMNRGHEIRDNIGFSESSTNESPRTEGVRQVWQDTPSQTERALHTGLIFLGSISYMTTATIELTMPSMSRSTSKKSSTRLHRKAFFLHAALMAGNIGLGIVESHALSNGNHQLVQGAGIAHLVIGFSVPVVMLGGGVLFKLPIDY